MSVYSCRVICHQRHVGLQQLAMLAASARSFLGPDKRYKFVVDQDGGGSTLACSPLRLLEDVDIGFAVGQLLLEMVQAHLKSFHTGTVSLVFMVGEWSTVVLECLHKGMPVRDVVSFMNEGLELCSKACQMSCLPLKEVIRLVSRGPRRQGNSIIASDQGSERVSSGSQGICAATRAPFSDLPAEGASKSSCLAGRSSQDGKFPTMVRHNIKLRQSRHFSQKEETTGTEVDRKRSIESSFLPRHNFEYQDIAFLANTVCHGSDSLMKLVTEASRIQTENTRCGDFSKCVFDVSKLVTCLLPGGSEERSCVVSGLVTFVSVAQASIIDRMKDQNLYIALISGDLSEKYRHLGYNSCDIRNIAGSLNPMRPSRGDKWVADILEILLQLKVNMLLVNGVVSEDLAEVCFQHNILIIERVRPQVSQDFAEVAGAIPVTYATQLNELCVGGGVQVTFWGGLSGIKSKRHRVVGVKIGVIGSALVTAVITSAVQAKLQALEDRFWGCAYRLHHALLDGKLLPGAGVTELLCVKHLLKAAKDNVEQDDRGRGSVYVPGGHSPYRSSILQHMSRGWINYIAMLMFNTGECSSELEACTVLEQDLKLEASRSTRLSDFWTQPSKQGVGDGLTTAVYDNVTVKLEAWRKALDLVLTVLQTDMEIITGISTTEGQGLEDFVLL